MELTRHQAVTANGYAARMGTYANARRVVARLAALDPQPRSRAGQRLVTFITAMHAHEARVLRLSVAEANYRTSLADWRVIEAQGDE